MKYLGYTPFFKHSGRSPRGERGLKFRHHLKGGAVVSSLPSRGAWIEIPPLRRTICGHLSLPSRGAWIEIRRPAGRRYAHPPSLPSRGAWIEILLSLVLTPFKAASLPSRGAWIEIWPPASRSRRRPRRSPRGERGLKWVAGMLRRSLYSVAPLAGSVD